jgi:hypothetical protein
MQCALGAGFGAASVIKSTSCLPVYCPDLDAIAPAVCNLVHTSSAPLIGLHELKKRFRHLIVFNSGMHGIVRQA